MKKSFIDDILKKGDRASPGAGSYEARINFDTGSRCSIMGSKLKIEEAALGRSKKLPGPGSYEHPSIVGEKTK